MAKRTHSFEMSVGATEGRGAIAAAMHELDWQVTSDGDVLRIREDPTRLCCRDSPLSADARVEELGPQSCRVVLDLQIPGWGPSRAARCPIAARASSSRFAATPPDCCR